MDIYNCLNCGKELIRARNTKKYCSGKCRLIHYRFNKKNNSVTEVAPNIIIAPKQAHISVSNTDETVIEELVYGKEE